MTHDIEYANEVGEWWDTLSESEQDDIDAVVGLLMTRGSQLRFPHSSKVRGTRHGHMRELRIQSAGKPIRIFYAFDPSRSAILRIGGDKTGNARFYKQYIPVADRLYDIYLEELRQEGLIP